MAIIVKYVVVADGKPDMIFSTRKEAEAHDKMLAIAERLTAFLQAAELNIAEDTLEVLTWFMAQRRVDISTLLKGGVLQTSRGPAQHAAVPQETQETSSASASKSSKTGPNASGAKPKTAA